MSKTALITGASKGIGKELALIFAQNKINLVLVARSSEILSEFKEHLQTNYSISVLVVTKDLCSPSSAQELFSEIKDNQIEIDYLVNNAGFGDYGLFADTSWERYEKMISLNVTTLTHLSHLFITDWKGRKSGRILNIASTAAFQPGPMMAVYFATKAFVLNLSEALGQELKNDNITITTLCSGPTHTSFGAESKMNASDVVKNVKIANAKDVAALGYKSMMKGKSTVIHGSINKLAPFAIRFMPRRWITKLSERVMRKS